MAANEWGDAPVETADAPKNDWGDTLIVESQETQQLIAALREQPGEVIIGPDPSEMNTPAITLTPTQKSTLPFALAPLTSLALSATAKGRKVVEGVGQSLGGLIESSTSPAGAVAIPATIAAPQLMVPLLTAEGIKAGSEEVKAGLEEGSLERVASGLTTTGVAAVGGMAASLPRARPTAPKAEVKPPPLPETPPPLPVEPISVGPGAASPAEFAARLEKPPGPPPLTIEPGPMPENVAIEVARKPADYNLFNRANRGQQAFTTGRLGQPAKEAFEKMALGEFEMRESIARDTGQYIEQLTKSLPRNLRKNGDKAFFEVLDGQPIETIEAQWASKKGGEQVIEAARTLKTRLEEIRTDIRDIKRENYAAYLQSLDNEALSDLYRNTIESPEGLPETPMRRSESGDAMVSLSKEEMSNALALAEFPDDWGIADGSYIPHMFFGQYRITAQLGDRVRFVNRAVSAAEAKAKIREFVRANPDLAQAKFSVEPDITVPADMVRLFDKRFFSMVNRMKEQGTIPEAEIRDALRGNVGRKASKQKWWGNLQERTGAQNYSKDFERVMSAYFSGHHRWRVLSRLNREVMPLIEKVKQQGRPNAALRLEGLMENLWGKPAKSTVEFDALLQEIPIVRDHVQPLALDRWSRFVRNTTAFAHLTNPKYYLINRLQPLQGLYPVIGERTIAQAKKLQHTAEGRTLLDKAGVTMDVGQYSEVIRGKLARVRERLSGERSNQELAFLGTYLHGLKQGMSQADAIKYGKLRGQLMTQFTPLTVDIPQLFEGPLAQSIFQYKRFSVGQLELIYNLLKEGRVGGVGRMMGVLTLTGGLNYYMRQFGAPADQKLDVQRSLEKELGEQGADALMFGLPGLVGADISGSLVIGEPPFGSSIYEQVGRTAVGPAVSTGIEVGKALLKDEREPMETGEKALAAARRVPVLRPFAEGIKLLSGDLDVTTPDGEVAYRRAIKDVLLSMGSFKSADESNMRIAVDGILTIAKEETSLKNDYYVAVQGGRGIEDVSERIQSFNKRWPEAQITQGELNRYVQRRKSGADKTDVERVIRSQELKQLLPKQ